MNPPRAARYRAAAGYSPDRVDALVWAFSELLVEPMKREGILSCTAATQRPPSSAINLNPPKTTSAIGSVEWLAEQKKSR
jgi:hypothetical protein